MKHSRTTVLASLPLLAGVWLSGCGDSGESDGDAGAGNLGGAASGGSLNGSGGTSSGGTGTGGAPDGPPVAGAELYDCSPPSGELSELDFQFVSVGDGFADPVLVTHAPNDAGRLFVVGQDGVISIITKTGSGAGATYATEATPFLNITPKVTRRGSEQGLLGLAFHPDFDENGLFYVHYSASSSVDPTDGANEGDTIVEEYELSGDPNVADDTTGRRVLHVPQPDEADNHKGGSISFGPDGYLYISLGDGGETSADAQSITGELRGNVLRIDPLEVGGEPYSSPSDNLVQTIPAAEPEIWSYGLRNPYRMNFDACTGDLYIGDVGGGGWEEINIQPSGAGRKNYGWPDMEGLVCNIGDCSAFVAPEAVIKTNGTAIIGGSVYRGSEIPALRGHYLYGQYNGTELHLLTFDGTAASTPVPVPKWNPAGDNFIGSLSSIQNGGDGEFYVTDKSGEVFKLVAE